MSEQTFPRHRPLLDGQASQPSLARRRDASLKLLNRYRWPLGAVGLLVVATLVMLWARTRPGYDPYGWLVWGHLTLHWKLDTNGAPSWKPLPYLFTAPYALLGRHALQLWMITAFAVSLSGLVFAWRVAFWLVKAPPERRYAAYAAGLMASVSLLAIYAFLSSILSAESDTMIVALCLAAVDCILCKRYRWAFWALWLAALGRPEAWALLGLYVIWAWREQPAMHRQMVIGLVLIPILWLGIPALTSRSALSPGSLAENSPRAIQGNKLTGTFERFLGLNAASIKIAALLAFAMAVVRRDRAVLLLTAGMLVWVAVEAAFALHGWSAVPRYLYEAGAGVCILAGVFVGRVILDSGAILARLRLPSSPQVAAWASVGLLAIWLISLVPAWHSRLTYERNDLAQQRARTHEIALLASVVNRLGAARILACGQPHIGIGWQSVLAWDLGTNTGRLFYSARYEKLHPHAIVNMYPHSYGWQFFPSNWPGAEPAACRGLSYRT